MEWVADLKNGLLVALTALVVAALIAWSIVEIASRAARVTLCATALVVITGILYSAFSLAVAGISSAAASTLGAIDGESGGKFLQIVSAVMPGNLVECMAIVFSVMISRLIYDWNVDFITRICS